MSIGQPPQTTGSLLYKAFNFDLWERETRHVFDLWRRETRHALSLPTVVIHSLFFHIIFFLTIFHQ